jgi:diguanylate cyclase (GGDEF)-like protein
MQTLHDGKPVMDLAIEVTPSSDAKKKLVINCAPISDPRGAVRGCVVTFDDLTQVHLANERLQAALTELDRLASHDSLTGCLTRRAFFERMGQAREEAIRNRKPLSCLALDIDQFKSVNDRFGHVLGDKVVQEVGGLLVSSLRAADIVGRYGGDEFFVGMPGCEHEQAIAIADKLRLAIKERCDAALGDVKRLHVTVSIGVATLNDSHSALADLIEHADKALYEAKSSGRNRVAAARHANSRRADRVANPGA